MKLVIVESPTKMKTITNFLDKNFKVAASYGHIRDLPKSRLGIDVNNNFEPQYIIPMKARKTVSQLKKLASKADEVLLATDPDREGEAIAYHLTEALKLDDQSYQRIVFHEITKSAILEALQNPQKINFDLVNAQQARRILDRLVGYELSPLLWKKVLKGLSAGRVQSPALRLIVEREKERNNFQPQIYYSLNGIFSPLKKEKIEIKAELFKINDRLLKQLDLKDKEEGEKIKADIVRGENKILTIQEKPIKRQPLPPFTTSTLQQTAYQLFKFSAKKTMTLAQLLYEGKNIDNKMTGLITYMRTDSFNISPLALSAAYEFIKKQFGPQYTLEKPRIFKSRSRLAQEAHEAIRPTDPFNTPEKIKPFLNPDEFKLYQLIWSRFIASQMPEAIFSQKNLVIETKSNQNYFFKNTSSTLLFDGFLKVYPFLKFEENLLPANLKEGLPLRIKKINLEEHSTQPPSRFNDASLIKTLEKYGIGRPSTYAPIISILLERGYVSRDQNKSFFPNEIGIIVNDLLVKHFPNIVDYQFTSQLEEDLDLIAQGKKQWQKVIKDFYFPFKEQITKKETELEKETIAPITRLEEKCPKCGKNLVSRLGRYGRFLACEDWPNCPYTKSINQEISIPCPLCKKGQVVIKRSKRGKQFYACSEWPNCQFASFNEPLAENCPICQSYLVKTKKKIKCSNKDCSYERPL
ncbi:MAG TPA: type I DNA topoisomerase [Candidatus Paceibacterota bacterium]|nr:type I DNA topoisomerase [Candidatus Paceibacterota bacterium]